MGPPLRGRWSVALVPSLASPFSPGPKVGGAHPTLTTIAYRSPMKILILGVNGFIGNALGECSSAASTRSTAWTSTPTTSTWASPGFHFREGDISIHREWIEYHVRKCDIILPAGRHRHPHRIHPQSAAGLRTGLRGKPAHRPLLREIQANASSSHPPPKSTACARRAVRRGQSNLVLGPIRMQRWIYSCIKQLLDRVIWAYGQKEGLDFTLFRPFNWIGPRLDSLHSARIGSSRAITQLILNLVEGTPIQLMDGGEQKRCFTDVDDGIECSIASSRTKAADATARSSTSATPTTRPRSPNWRNPTPPFQAHPNIRTTKSPPGSAIPRRGLLRQGFQDVACRKPSIVNARALLGWEPVTDLHHVAGDHPGLLPGGGQDGTDKIYRDAPAGPPLPRMLWLLEVISHPSRRDEVDVDTLKGFCKGVPPFWRCFEAHAVRPASPGPGYQPSSGPFLDLPGSEVFWKRCGAPGLRPFTASTICYGTLLPSSRRRRPAPGAAIGCGRPRSRTAETTTCVARSPLPFVPGKVAREIDGPQCDLYGADGKPAYSFAAPGWQCSLSSRTMLWWPGIFFTPVTPGAPPRTSPPSGTR